MIDTPKRLAAVYLRCSDSRQDMSIQRQRDEVQRYAERSGYAIAAEYVDDGIPGDKAHRPAFERMVRESPSADWKTVIVWKGDRLSRADIGKWWVAVDPLRDAGVTLVTTDRGELNWTDTTGQIICSVEQGPNHEYSQAVARNVASGRTKKAREGRFTGARTAFGYRRINAADDPDRGRLEIVESEAVWVRRMFDWYLSGLTSWEIADRLNAEGIKTRFGGEWGRQTVRRTLKNPVYIGTLRVGNDRRAKYKPVEAVVTENAHSAIVTDAVFAAAGRAIHRRQKCTSPRRDAGYPLTGLAVCGYCGSSMHGHGPGGQNPSYVCSRWNRSRECCPNRSNEAELLDSVSQAVDAHYGTPAALEVIREQIVKKVAESCAGADLDGLRKEHAKLCRSVERMAVNMSQADPDIFPVLQAKYKAERQSLDTVAAELEAASVPADVIVAKQMELAQAAFRAAARIRETIHNGERRLCRELLAAIVDRVEVTAEKQSNRWRIIDVKVHVPTWCDRPAAGC